ncbi:permease [Enterovibrio norvegicus]|uniref:permease n=1 Tax=Enterovibrio norvegicus TaxID=188144 RepID=UPI0013D2EF80|nr:permease [Enterovibrio norvegicus]
MNTDIISSTLGMFAFLAVEITLLFLAISYLVGVLQMYIPPARIRNILSSKNGKGYFMSAFLGAITPFCSCSTIPFLKGLIRAQAGFGTMMVFLLASPLLNPMIIGLFAVTFGLEVTIYYFTSALLVSVAGGYLLEKFGFEKYVKEEAYAEPAEKASTCGTSCSGNVKPVSKWLKIWQDVWKDFKRVLPYILVGVGIGSLIYGAIPTDWIASFAGNDNPFAIPFAAIVGIPLYIRAEAVILLSAPLAAKGMSMGAIMALVIGSAGASLTEVILLKSLFRNQMIIAFLAVVLGMAVITGYSYGFLF